MFVHDSRKCARYLGNPSKVMKALESMDTEHKRASADFLRRLNSVIPLEYRNYFFTGVSVDTLVEWMQDPPVSNAMFETMLETRTLPTPSIVATLDKLGCKEDMIKEIQAEKETIRHGGFDPSNRLHVELEYSIYVTAKSTWRNFGSDMLMSLNDFYQIPVRESGIALGTMDFDYAKKTALEAAEVFELIRKKKSESADDYFVIGNRRYGANFVVMPLGAHLTKLRVQIRYEYIGSTNPSMVYCDHDLWHEIKEKMPAIAVIDGTKNCKREGFSRFPASMWGYVDCINAVKHSNQNPSNSIYSIDFWSPQITDLFYVGNYPYRPDSRTGERKATIVCANGQGMKYSGAYFDNIETNIKNIFVFTESGLAMAKNFPNENIYTEKIKELIAEDLKRLL